MWLRPHGYARIDCDTRHRVSLDHLRCEEAPAGAFELDMFMCAHCGRHIHVMARMRPEDIGGTCPGCWKPVCPWCVDKGCEPLEKRIAEQERRDEILRSYRDCA
jgi:hypothetical protein